MTKRNSVPHSNKDYHIFVQGRNSIAYEFNLTAKNSAEALILSIDRWENTRQDFFKEFKGIRIKENSSQGKIVCEIGELKR